MLQVSLFSAFGFVSQHEDEFVTEPLFGVLVVFLDCNDCRVELVLGDLLDFGVRQALCIESSYVDPVPADFCFHPSSFASLSRSFPLAF